MLLQDFQKILRLTLNVFALPLSMFLSRYLLSNTEKTTEGKDEGVVEIEKEEEDNNWQRF